MAGAFLLALLDEADALAAHRLAHFVGLMTDHHKNSLCGSNLPRGRYYVLHQRLASRAVQHLGHARLHTGAKSRGENHYGNRRLHESIMSGFVSFAAALPGPTSPPRRP